MKPVHTVALIALLCLLSACDAKKAPTPPADTAPLPTTSKGVTQPSQEVMDQIEKAYQEAKALADQAYKFRQEGIEIEKSDGLQAARLKYVKARELYQSAMGMLEAAMDPEDKSITEEQADAFLKRYRDAYGAWAKEKVSVPQVPKLQD